MNAWRPLRTALLLGLMSWCLVGQLAFAAQAQDRVPANNAGGKLPPGIYVQDDRLGESTAIQWTQGSQAHFGWRELEPEPGTFDFTLVEAWLARLDKSGKKGILGVPLRCHDGDDGQDACAPTWALAWDPVVVLDRPQLNYLDPLVRKETDRFIAALARRYARDSRLAAVEITPGYQGGISPCPLTLEANDRPDQCAAYTAHYRDLRPADGSSPSAWEGYLDWIVSTYGAHFRAAGGDRHVPLQTVISGKFQEQTERATVVSAALAIGSGLHDAALAPDFLDGERHERRCAQDWLPGEPGYSERIAYQSHWVPLERHWAEAAISFQPAGWRLVPDRDFSDEEAAWWSVLNALDKHAIALYVPASQLQWEQAWRYFSRYAGRNERTTPDAWIALRGARAGWCPDAGDYGWYLVRHEGAADGSDRAHAPDQPGGRAGATWHGAFSRETDLPAGRPSLYFDLDDGFARGGESIASVEVTYWDGTPDMAGLRWELAYDAAGSPGQVAGSVTLSGSERWLTQPFILLDAAFRNRLPDVAGGQGSDLRLTATGIGDVRFHMLRVQLLTGLSTPLPRARQLPAVTQTPLPAVAVPAASAQPSAVVALTPTLAPTLAPTATPSPEPAAEPTATQVPSPGPSPTSASPDVLRFEGRVPSGNVRDTYVTISEPETAHGDANTLVVRGDGDAGALFYFNLGDLPQGARVTGAWLELTVLGSYKDGEMPGALFALRRAWDAGATWDLAGTGSAWASPGLAAGDDYGPAAEATFVLKGPGVLQVPLTRLVETWLRHPEENHGALLRGGDGDAEYYVASSEWRKLEARPRLRVRLAGDTVPTNPPSLPSITPTATIQPAFTPAPTASPSPSADVIARVASVAPSAGTTDGSEVDVVVYLYTPDGNSLPCDANPAVRLWVASGAAPGRPAGKATRTQVTQGGLSFPAWRFSPVQLGQAPGPDSLIHLYATVDGMRSVHNIVTLGGGEGTHNPLPTAPERVADEMPDAMDASIEIAWPHGDRAVQDADRANLTVALFSQGTRTMLPADLEQLPPVRLHWSVAGGIDLAPGLGLEGQARLVRTPWLSYYLWDFNDVDVSAAREAGHYINFWVEVEGAEHATNVWSHGYGLRPVPEAPLPLAGCR